MRALHLGGLRIDPPLVLAPMLHLTGRAFRAVVRELGGCGLFYSEMLSAERVLHESETSPIRSGFGQEPDLMLQLVGDDPRVLGEAVRILEGTEPAGFDLNLGCTKAKITQRGWGADLLSSRSRTAAALRSMRAATACPLTVKLRNGWTRSEAAEDYLHMLADEGVNAVVLHPRTPDPRYGLPARWEWIAEVKSKLSIPVIGNGDIREPADALRMFDSTGCDGSMIGRAAIARPSLFREVRAALARQAAPPVPTAQAIWQHFWKHLSAEPETPKRFLELRTFCQYFAEGFAVPHWFWGPLQGCRIESELVQRVQAYFEGHDPASTPETDKATWLEVSA